MASNYTYGSWWVNGRLAKPFFHSPAMNIYLKNIKRLILENQEFALNLVAENEEFPYSATAKPNEALVPFNEKNVHYGIWKDQTSHALYINCNISSLFTSNSRRDDIEVRIAATTGAQQTFEKAYSISTLYLTAIQIILESMDPRELVFGWNGEKLPKIAIGGEHSQSPTVLALSTDLGAVPELIFNFAVFPQRYI